MKSSVLFFFKTFAVACLFSAYGVRGQETGEFSSGAIFFAHIPGAAAGEPAQAPDANAPNSVASLDSSGSANLWDWAKWQAGGDREMRELLDRAYWLYDPEPPKTTDGVCPCNVCEYEKERDKLGGALERWWRAYGAVNGWKAVANASKTFGDAMATALKVYGFGTPEGDAVGGVVDRINETILNYGENKGTVVSAGVRASTVDIGKLIASLKTMKNWSPGKTLEERVEYAQGILDFRNEMRKAGDLGTLNYYCQGTGVRVAALNDVLKFTDTVASLAQTFVDEYHAVSESAKYFNKLGEAVATLDEMKRAVPYFENVMGYFRRQAASCLCGGDCSCAHCARKRGEPLPSPGPKSGAGSAPAENRGGRDEARPSQEVVVPVAETPPQVGSQNPGLEDGKQAENPRFGSGGELMARYQQLRDQWVDYLEHKQKMLASKSEKEFNESWSSRVVFDAEFRRHMVLKESISDQIGDLFAEDYRSGHVGWNEVCKCELLVPRVRWYRKSFSPGDAYQSRESHKIGPVESYRIGPVERCSDREMSVYLNALRKWAEAEELDLRPSRWVFKKQAFLAAIRNPELYRYSYWCKKDKRIGTMFNSGTMFASRWEYTDYYYYLIVDTDNGPRILVYSRCSFKPMEAGGFVDLVHGSTSLADLEQKGTPYFKVFVPSIFDDFQPYTFYELNKSWE